MSFYLKEEIKGASLEELLEDLKSHVLSFQYKPHPDYQMAIKEIEQEITTRVNKIEEPEEWTTIDSMVKIKGRSFYCKCGCNVFRKSLNNDNRWQCNSCSEIYESE